MDWINANWTNILAIYGAIVALATVIVKVTPTTRDDEILGKVIAVLNVFSTVNTPKDAAVIEKAEKK